MKCEINSETMAKALQSAKNATNSKSPLVLIHIKDSVGVITGANEEMQIGADFTAHKAEDGACAVDANDAYSVFKAFGKATVNIVLEEKQIHVSTVNNNTSMTIPIMDADKFSGRDLESYFEEAIEVDGEPLSRALSKVQHACANERSTTDILKGIHIVEIEEEEGNFIQAGATDGFRLSLTKFQSEGLQIPKEGIVIPLTSSKELARMMKDRSSLIHYMEGLFLCKSGSEYMMSSLLAGNYPLISRLVQPREEHLFKLPKEALSKAISRALTIMGNQYVAVLSSENGYLVLQGEHQGKKSFEKLPIKTDEEIRVGINLKYLQDALNTIESDEVAIGYMNAPSPIRILDPVDPNTFHIIMPAKV